jgi:putative copper resistance protein D
MIVYQLSVFLHILSAVIWIGGMFFLALVVVPATRGLPPAERAALFGTVGRRFRTVGWVCIAILIVTGMVNSGYRGVTWENLTTAELWGSPFGSTLALKLGVVAVMLGLSIYHDVVLGPRTVRMLEQAAPAMAPNVLVEAQRLRRRASLVGRLEAILALIVLALAIMLVRGVPLLF